MPRGLVGCSKQLWFSPPSTKQVTPLDLAHYIIHPNLTTITNNPPPPPHIINVYPPPSIPPSIKTGFIPESGEPTYGTGLPSSSFSLTPWSYQDRISVLGGLCEVLKTSQQASEHISKAHNECQKLLTITAKQRFREADFMKVVQGLAGDEGVSVCRALLDGIDDQDALEAQELQSRVTVGE